MELAELKDALVTLDRRLERHMADARSNEANHARDTLRASLRPLAQGQIAQIVFGVLAILLGVATWKSDLVRFGGVFASGVVLHLYGVVTIALSGVMLLGIRRIDDAGPVLAVQRRLASLKRTAIVSSYALGMTWWVLWVPCVVAIFRVAFGIDLFRANPGVVGWLVATGVAGFVATALVHRWASRSGRPRVAAAFDNALTGTSLRRAQAQCDELARFARE